MCSIILQLKKFLLANFKDKSGAFEQRDRKERQAQPNSHSEQKFKKPVVRFVHSFISY